MNKCFFEEDFANFHDKYRSPNLNVIKQYISKIQQHTHVVEKILDIGAGTGHFCIPFASSFSNPEVIALEPSLAMSNKISEKIKEYDLYNIKIINQYIDSITETNFDLIWISEAIHLFEDKKLLLQTLKNKLTANGIIAIRTPSHTQLQNRGWYNFYPLAKLIDLERHPSIPYISSILQYFGFNTFVYQIDESRTIGTESFIEMLTNKSYSSLGLIPEADFNHGAKHIKNSNNNSHTMVLDYHMTLLIATDNGLS